MNTATTDVSAIVLRRSLETTRDGFCAVALFSMNSRTIDLNYRGWETWNQCHAGTIAK
jgi:hypothetical protein